MVTWVEAGIPVPVKPSPQMPAPIAVTVTDVAPAGAGSDPENEFVGRTNGCVSTTMPLKRTLTAVFVPPG